MKSENCLSSNDEDTSVQVAVRVRPLSTFEKSNGEEDHLELIQNNAIKIPIKNKQFTFDFAYGIEVNQSKIYETSVLPLVENFFKGYNATVLAYGQTGSGKTYTMGTSSDNLSNQEDLGVIPRAMNTIFSLIDEKKASEPAAEFYLRVQFLELYGEELRDLLSDESVVSLGEKGLSIRENPLGGVSVIGASEENVSSAADMFAALERGSLCRTTASTNMNLHSSRSHAIFTIIIEQHLPRSADVGDNLDSQDETEYRTAKFHFVDLAGSERAKKTGAKGKRLREGININMGLLALGNVISALGSPEDKSRKVHVPYRSSKLTRLLQDSLGGNSKTLMIACVSPSSLSVEETVNTLRYANRAKNIKNKPIVNTDPASSQIALLKREINTLKQQLSLNGPYATDAELEGQLIKVTDALKEEKSARSELREKYLNLLAENETLKSEFKRQGISLPAGCINVEARNREEQYLKVLEENKSLKKKLRDTSRENFVDDITSTRCSISEEQELEEMKKELRDFEEAKENIGLFDGEDKSEREINEVEEDIVAIQQKFIKSQEALKQVVNNYDNSLKEKEEMVHKLIEDRKKYTLMKESYEQKLEALQAEVELTRRHRKELNSKITELETKATNNSFSEKDLKKYRAQLEKLRVEIRSKDDKLKILESAAKKLKEATREGEKMIRKEKKISREIEHMKRQKVEYQRQMEENSRKYREERAARRREIARLKKNQLTLQKEKNKFELKNKRDEQLLKLKSEKLVAIQRKYRNAQKMQRGPSKQEIEEVVARKMHARDVREKLKLKDEIEHYQRLLKKKEAALQRIKLINKRYRECQEGIQQKNVNQEKEENSHNLKAIFESQFANENQVRELSDLKKMMQRAKAEVAFRNEQLDEHENKCVHTSESTDIFEKISDIEANVTTIDEARAKLKNLISICRSQEISNHKLRAENQMLRGLDVAYAQPKTINKSTRRQSKMMQLSQLEQTVERLQFTEKKWKNKTVFDRLTSVDHFTGIHKRKALDNNQLEKQKIATPVPAPSQAPNVKSVLSKVESLETKTDNDITSKFSLKQHMLEHRKRRLMSSSYR